MVDALMANQLPAEISNSAGTYLCNNVMYSVLRNWGMGNKLAGFIHLPASHELAVIDGKIPSWSQSDLTTAIEICIQTLSKKA